jgi:hypothetical protein
VGLEAGIQEEGFVEEAAYLEAYLCKELVGEREHYCRVWSTYLRGNLTCQAAEQSLVEDLEGAAAYLDRVSARTSITFT